MNSREAFEAHIRIDFRSAETADEYLRKSSDEQYLNARIHVRWLSWQAAIQHARDVATAKCAEISEREHRDFKGLNPDALASKKIDREEEPAYAWIAAATLGHTCGWVNLFTWLEETKTTSFT